LGFDWRRWPWPDTDWTPSDDDCDKVGRWLYGQGGEMFAVLARRWSQVAPDLPPLPPHHLAAALGWNPEKLIGGWVLTAPQSVRQDLAVAYLRKWPLSQRLSAAVEATEWLKLPAPDEEADW
jgi:hypothetical protein